MPSSMEVSTLESERLYESICLIFSELPLQPDCNIFCDVPEQTFKQVRQVSPRGVGG